MIQRLELKNFRCFEHVNVPLKPLTVLIGKNDTGKSSFMAALNVIANGPFREGDLRQGANAADCQLWFDLGSRADKIPYSLGTYSPTPELGGGQAFAVRPELISAEVQGSNVPPILRSTGLGVPALVDYLLRKDIDQFFRLQEALRRNIPGFKRLLVENPQPATRTLSVEIDGATLPLGDCSDGVRLIAFFLALAHHPTPPGLILLEEPENGVHPKRLADIVNILRGIALGATPGTPPQIVVSTHSPFLLDEVDLSRDEVLVFTRQDDGRRVVEAVDRERLAGFLKEFMLGEIWFNREEEGLVAKRP